jgi:hypothetical protein
VEPRDLIIKRDVNLTALSPSNGKTFFLANIRLFKYELLAV